MRAAIYVRVSTLDQAEEGYSIDEQIDKLKKYCEVKDWQVIEIYTDPGFTGSNLDRPGLKKLLRDIENKRIETVLVYKLDRLSRSQKDTLYLIEDVFVSNNVSFVSLNENFDTSTAFGKAMIGILAVFAQLEREQIKERMQMGKLGRAKSGKAMSWNFEPFGYTHKNDSYEINQLESVIVKQMFNEYLNGLSITKLKDKLNSEGHIGKDIDWSYRSIKFILTNPIYCGFTKYKDQLFEGNHTPIISKEIFDNVQTQIKIRQTEAYKKNNNPRPFQAKYMISGLVRCGHCGAALGLHQYGVKKDGTRTKIYKCHSKSKKKSTMKKADFCPSKDYKQEELEDLILNEIEKLRLNPTMMNDTPSEYYFDSALLKKRYVELDKKMEKLVGLYLDDNLSIDFLNNKKDEIQKEKNSIEEKLSQQHTESDLSADDAIDVLGNLNGSIFNKSYEVQKQIVRQLVKEIVLKDDETLIYWRFKN